MTPEEARWLEKYFGPAGDFFPWDNLKWVSDVDLEQHLIAMAADFWELQEVSDPGDVDVLPPHPSSVAAKALLEEIKGVDTSLRADFFAYWDPAKLRKNVNVNRAGLLSHDEWYSWRNLPRDERGVRPKQPTGASSMPVKGNLRLAPSGIWQAYDGQDWVFLGDYYPASAAGRGSLEQQKKAVSDLQKALNTMGVTEVTGTGIGNYEFTIGPPPLINAYGVLNTRQLQEAADRQYRQGVQPHQQYTVDIFDELEKLGLSKDDIWEEHVLYDKDGQEMRENKTYDPVSNKYIWSGKVVKEKRINASVISAGLAMLQAKQGFVGNLNTSGVTEFGQKYEWVNGRLLVGPMPKDETPLGEGKVETVTLPDSDEVIAIRVTEPDGKVRYLDPVSPKAEEWTLNILSKGGTVASDVPRPEAPLPGQPGAPGTTGGLPVTPFGQRKVDPSDALIENIVPGYDMVLTGPERWELIPQPGFTPRTRAGQVIQEIVPGYDAVATADGRLQLVEKVPGPGEELPLFKPYAMGDGRFIIRTGPDDYETVTSAGESWFLSLIHI